MMIGKGWMRAVIAVGMGLALVGCVPAHKYEPLTLAALDLGQSRTLAIQGNGPWRDTNITMHKGEVYRAVTLGTWSPGGLCGEVTSAGLPAEHLLCMKGIFAANFPRPESKIGALVGRIGLNGNVFDVANTNGFIADRDGILFLRMNDPDGFMFDNTGHIDVAIQRYGEGVKTPVVVASRAIETGKEAVTTKASPKAKPGIVFPTGPPEELVKRGLLAAQSGDFNTAVNNLASAIEQTGPNPTNAFNLALAQSKAGNALAAAAWLRVYLAMAPNAPNATQVRAEVHSLEAKVPATIKVLLDQAYDIALTLPEVPHSNEYREPKKISSINSIVISATHYGYPELVGRADAESGRIANRLGYTGRRPYTASLDVQTQMDQAEKSGDIRRIKELWAQEQYKDALDFAFEALADLSAKAAVEEYQGLPKDMREPTDKYIYFVVKSLLDEDKVEMAEAFYSDMPYNADRALAAGYIAEHHLRNGNLKAAREWASKCTSHKQESVRGICKTILGDSHPVMAYYTSGAARPCDLCTSFTYRLGDLTPQLIQLGEIDTAQRAADHAKALAATAEYDDQRDMAKLAQAFVDLAKGKTDAAVRYGKSTTALKGFRNRFIRESIAYAISAGKIKVGKRLINEFALLKDKAEYLRRLAARADDSGDLQTGTQLRSQADKAETLARGGWTPSNTSHLERVMRWYHRAFLMQQSIRTGHLQEAIQEAKEAKGQDVISKLNLIIQQWHVNLAQMRVLEHYEPVMGKGG